MKLVFLVAAAEKLILLRAADCKQVVRFEHFADWSFHVFVINVFAMQLDNFIDRISFWLIELIKKLF